MWRFRFTQVVLVAHATYSNAALTPWARLRLGQLVVDHGWLPARVAEQHHDHGGVPRPSGTSAADSGYVARLVLVAQAK